MSPYSALRACALSLFALGSLPAAQGASFHRVDLGKLNDPGQINKRGEIAAQGCAATGAIVYRAGAWHRLRDLGSWASAVAIPAGGDVAGNMASVDGVSEFYDATVWTRGGMRSVITMPDGSATGFPQAIAGDLTVVGGWVPPGHFRDHGFRGTPGGRSVDLGMMADGHECLALAIHEVGQIVGSATVTLHGYPRAFLYEAGVFRNLGIVPGGDRSIATAINSRGHVVGTATVDAPGGVFSTDLAPFFWSEGKMRQLPTPPNDTDSWATSINEHGGIVGYRFSNTDNQYRALAFSLSSVTLLDSEVDALDDGNLQDALGINADGAIIGWGTRTDGDHGFMRVPLAAESSQGR